MRALVKALESFPSIASCVEIPSGSGVEGSYAGKAKEGIELESIFARPLGDAEVRLVLIHGDNEEPYDGFEGVSLWMVC